MPRVLIGLGANLGQREVSLQRAIDALSDRCSSVIPSPFYRFEAVGGPNGQDAFLNCAALVSTDRTPAEFHQILQSIECAAGRQRSIRWSARTLDCDLLLYDEQIISTSQLQVPHPRMHTRRFVLQPAADVAGDLRHPVFGWTIRQLFEHLETALPYFCVLGSCEKRVEALTEGLIAKTGLQRVGTKPQGIPGETTIDSPFPASISELLETLEGDVQSNSIGWVSSFSHWETECSSDSSAVGFSTELPVKLVMVLDSMDSEFGRRMLSLDQSVRRPMLFLSADFEHALQDAVGAVESMK